MSENTSAAIFGNLRRLTDFSGRQRRSHFWPFVALVVVGGMVCGWIFTVPMMFLNMQAFERTNAMPDFTGFFAVTAAVTILHIALLAAAVARRLHDRAMSGAWGLMPVPFVLCGLGGMFYMFRGFMNQPDLGLFFLLFANNAVYMVTLVILIVLLALEGTRGPNRYGPDPKG